METCPQRVVLLIKMSNCHGAQIALFVSVLCSVPFQEMVFNFCGET